MIKYLSAVELHGLVPEDAYFYDLPPVRYLREKNRMVFESPVTFFVGENGTGKSTLLEAIALCCGFNPEGGSKHFRFSTENTHSTLGEYLTPVRKAYFKDGFFLRAESFYNMATYLERLEEDDPCALESYGGRSLHKQSHGESFLALVQNRFGGNGLYLLDEPESALSPSRLLVLLTELRRLTSAGSQFIISTHSPILMAFPNAEVFLFQESGLRVADYRETEHFRLTKQFLNNPEQMLHYLFSIEDTPEEKFVP